MLATCDTLETIAGFTQIATAVLAFVALGFAARSANAAVRSSQATVRGLEAQNRPRILDVEPTPYPRPDMTVRLPSGDLEPITMHGEIIERPDEGLLFMPVRNVGRGEALIEVVELDIAPGRSEIVRGAASRRVIAPEGETWLALWVGRASLAFEAYRDAINHGAGIIAHITYSNSATGRRYASHFQLARPAGTPWHTEHFWTTDDEENGPRPRRTWPSRWRRGNGRRATQA